MRWIAEKNGHQVQHVLPGTVVHLETDGPVVPGEPIRVFEEPEAVIRTLLRKFRRDTRQPVAALRWEPMATAPPASIRSSTWQPGQVGFDPTPTRYVAEASGQRSPTLYVGGPVHITESSTAGVEGGLGVPILPAVALRASASAADARAVRWTANGAVDPVLVIRLIGLGDELFTSLWRSKLAQIRIRYEIRQPPLEDALFETLRSRFPEASAVSGSKLRVHVDEGGSVPVEVPVYGLPPGGAPVAVAVLDSHETQIVSVSQLAVIVRPEAVK